MFPKPATTSVSTEWALQLAYLVGFPLDFDKEVHVMHAYRIDRVKAALWWKVNNINNVQYRTPDQLPQITVILDQQAYDPINDEITIMGYNQEENVLVFGYTLVGVKS